MRHLAAALCLLSAPAFAQSNPSFITGQIPTAAQWNSYFGKKADVTGGTINNGVLNSVTINGSLGGSPTVGGVWTASNATLSGFAITGGAFTAGALVSNAFPITLQDVAGHAGAIVLNFPTNAAILAYKPDNIGASMVTARVAGRLSAGDGGAATYLWNAASVLSPDTQNSLVIQPTGWSASGRWIIDPPPGGISPIVAGAKCDGTTNDRTVIGNLGLAMFNLWGGGVVSFPLGKTCLLSTTYTMKTGLVFRGQSPSGQDPSNAALVPNLTLAAGATLSTGVGPVVIDNMSIAKTGIVSGITTMEQAIAYQNTLADGSICVTFSGQKSVIQNSEVYGCQTAIFANAAQSSIQNVRVDGANGLEATASGGGLVITGFYVGDIPTSKISGTHKGVSSILSVAAGGTLYTDQQVVPMSASGATCATLPSVKVTVSAGVVTSAIVNDTGDCTVVPNNPASFPGSPGSGATLNLNWVTAQYRSGTGINIHDDADGVELTNAQVESYHIGLHLSNLLGPQITNFITEPGLAISNTMGDLTSRGILTENCLNSAHLSNIHMTAALGIPLYLNQRPAANGGSCGDILATAASVDMSNVNLQNSTGAQFPELLYVGPFAATRITNLRLGTTGNPGGVAGPAAVFDANAGPLQILGFSAENQGSVKQWYSVDSATVSSVFIANSAPNFVALNSGASLTAFCGQTIRVNDTTAPTITLPAACPLGQDVVVEDSGGNAAAHNITLSAPGGSTINGGASVTISTAFDRKAVSYDNVAAYAH